MENTNGIVQATYSEILGVKAALAKLESRIDDISFQVQKATFNNLMGGCDISEFFPVKRQDQLECFMDRDHPEWPSRKTEFQNFLLTTVSNKKRGFGKGLIQALFTRAYICTVKWPSYG